MFAHQSNRNDVQAEPEHHPGASAELLGLFDAGRADRAAGKLSFSPKVLSTPGFVPGFAPG